MLVSSYNPELTSYYHRSCHCVRGATHGCEIDVHRVDDILEVEGNFDVKDLPDIVSDYTDSSNKEESITFAPINSVRAVPTRNLVPQSPCASLARIPQSLSITPYLRPQILCQISHNRPICLSLLFVCSCACVENILRLLLRS
jgi:hypothetical protein